MESEKSYKFLRKRHVAYLRRCLSILPESAVTYDTSRMTVLFFAVSGLDILGAIDEIPKAERDEIVEWIYTLQLTSAEGHKYGGFRGGHCISNIFDSAAHQLPGDVKAVLSSRSTRVQECNGHSTNNKDSELDIRLSEGQIPPKILRQFAPAGRDHSPASQSNTASQITSSKSPSILPADGSNTPPLDRDLDSAHIAMTYSALASLVVLGDDLSRVDKRAVLRHVASLQCADGSFFSNCGGSENDLRFVYCAAVVCYLLGDMQAFNTTAAVRYIRECLGYGGALGQGGLQESHGGSTYCGVAALHLMGALQCINLFDGQKNEQGSQEIGNSRCKTGANWSCSLSEEELAALVRWLLMRQEDAAGRCATGEVNMLAGGLQGRPNKPADTCYTFWVGAALKMLGCADMLDKTGLQQFVLSTQDPLTGGLAKYSSGQPDGMHTFLGLSGLSVLGLLNELSDVDPALNITRRAKGHWESLKMNEM